MKKQDWYFILAAAVVIGVFVFLSVFSRKPPPLTAGSHAGMTRETSRDTCLECHAPDSAIKPMTARHPKKGRPPDKTTPCYACHEFPPTSAAALIGSTRIVEGVFVWPNRQGR
ncbi:MAG TPA: hypothetical protein VJH03_01835 [Blastocatellia bacterium]|nr:hypothetical protein [Blastocatellia bacterium]